MIPEFARITTIEEAEPAIVALGLTDDLIKEAIRHTDREDAHIDDVSYDRGHRGFNRWGHTLAFLRRELKPFGWTWKVANADLSADVVPEDNKKLTLRNVVSPDGLVQVCVASSTWVDGVPWTLAKGVHTIDAVESNRQLWLLPQVEVDADQLDSEPKTTLILCVGRTVRPGEIKGTVKEVEYRYELSAPEGMKGKGERRRVVSWRYRCFKGTVTCNRLTKPLKDEERYDHEGTEGLVATLPRK